MNIMLSIQTLLIVFLMHALMPPISSSLPVYKDASSPDGVPDFPQGDADICSRAAWTNSLWFLDGRKQEGAYKWPKIVKNTDEANRKKNWHKDGLAVRDDLVKRWLLTEEEKQGLKLQQAEIELDRKENRRPKRVFRLKRRVGEFAILDYLKDQGYADVFERSSSSRP